MLGLAMTLVVLVGGIDLSVGSVVLASATLAGIGLAEGLHPAVAVLMGIGIGAAVGLVNAVLVEGLRISPVIITLGTMIAVRGLSLVALGRYNSWLEIKGPIFDDLARRTVARHPPRCAGGDRRRPSCSGLCCASRYSAARCMQSAMRRSPRGWPACASNWLRASAYVGCGALAGAAGVLVAARTGLISPSIGGGLEFFAIAVVALGAGGLPAGRVSVGQTIIGVLILMMIFNYMTIRGVPGTWQTTATGLLLLAAMVGGRLLQRNSGTDAGAGRSLPRRSRQHVARRRRGGAQLDGGGDAAACGRLRQRSIRASSRSRISTRWWSRTRRSPSSRSAR